MRYVIWAKAEHGYLPSTQGNFPTFTQGKVGKVGSQQGVYPGKVGKVGSQQGDYPG